MRLFCGSWLACDADNGVCQLHRGDAIAGKPAPTFVLWCVSHCASIVETDANACATTDRAAPCHRLPSVRSPQNPV
ncbi:hypothetical protein BZL43_06950 [Pseudomonas sp. PICF141]|nr:hypothetical protein BZL43_06950 [Pseudomonas sp. PICF141]